MSSRVSWFPFGRDVLWGEGRGEAETHRRLTLIAARRWVHRAWRGALPGSHSFHYANNDFGTQILRICAICCGSRYVTSGHQFAWQEIPEGTVTHSSSDAGVLPAVCSWEEGSLMIQRHREVGWWSS